MKFKITRHSGFSAPPDALDQLFEKLPARADAVSFSKSSQGSRPHGERTRVAGRTEEELAAIGRREVLDVVVATCEPEPELSADWFAVSVLR